MAEAWPGWILAGVPEEVRDDLISKGINHRLVGLMGTNAEQATNTIHKVLSSRANGETIAAVLRAWRLGAHVVALEVSGCVWAELTHDVTASGIASAGGGGRHKENN